MKFLRVIKTTREELCPGRYKYFCFFLYLIPLTVIYDWNDGIPNKKDGDEGFMHREYYFLGVMIWKKKHKTKCWIPNSR